MSSPISVRGNNRHGLDVSRNGEVYTSNLNGDISESVLITTGGVANAVNIYPPKVGHKFIITGISMYGGQNNSKLALPIISYSDVITTTAADPDAFSDALSKGDRTSFTSLRIEIPEGKYINAWCFRSGSTYTATTYVTLLGYYEEV